MHRFGSIVEHIKQKLDHESLEYRINNHTPIVCYGKFYISTYIYYDILIYVIYFELVTKAHILFGIKKVL